MIAPRLDKTTKSTVIEDKTTKTGHFYEHMRVFGISHVRNADYQRISTKERRKSHHTPTLIETKKSIITTKKESDTSS